MSSEFPDPKTGLFQIEWRENGRRLTRSLKHRDWRRAKRQADEFAAGYLGPEMHGKAEAEPEPLTLERLFDIYGEEVTPTKRGQSRLHDRAAMRMFLGCFGRDRKPATLSQRDWDRCIRERRAGRVGPSGKPVSDRMIERDLKFLIAVLNWAGKSRDAEGKVLLESNPLKGLKTPTEKNPARIVLTEVEYQALLRVSRQVDWRFRVALVLAHETGHRINAIRQLRWSDIDLENGMVRWRAEHEKTGYEHRTPVTVEAIAVLEEARTRNPGIGGCSGAALAEVSHDACEPAAGARLVDQSSEARGAGAEAWPRLALTEAEVRLGPHGPAAQGALRTRRLEGGQDGAAVLPARRRGPAQERARQPPQSSGLNPISGNQLAGIRHVTLVSSMRAKGCTSATACPQGLRQLLF